MAQTAEPPQELHFVQYHHNLEAQYLPAIRALISKDLSEPYSIYVYRYFLCQWAHLCFMVCQARLAFLLESSAAGCPILTSS
jgi:peptide alpha-N-acetyltransferase